MANTYSPAWFATFGRPEEAATRIEVEFLLRFLSAPPSSVLDVPCGFGRHAKALAARGYRVTGVEFDAAAAAEARVAGIVAHELDMRRLRDLPGEFDAVICMWASFGWFDDEANTDVLAAMAAKTAMGGTLVLDVYNPAFFHTRQGPWENAGVREDKRIVGNRLRTRIEYPNGSQDKFDWRLYEPEELRELGARLGLRLDAVCAAFDSEKAPSGETPRTQLVFRRDT